MNPFSPLSPPLSLETHHDQPPASKSHRGSIGGESPLAPIKRAFENVKHDAPETPEKRRRVTTGFPAHRLVCPPTPRKDNRLSIFNPTGKPTPMSAFQTASLQAQSLKITTGKHVIELSELSEGSFMNVYKIEKVEAKAVPPNANDKEKESLEGIDVQAIMNAHNQLVLKTYKMTHRPKALPKFMQNSLENYRQALAHGIPVARIYNVDTARNDGYVIQEFIPHPINLDDPDQVKQIREFFFTAMQNNLILDLLPKNLGVEEDGRVKLFDFVEERDSLQLYINHAIVQFTLEYKRIQNKKNRKNVETFLTNFTHGFDKYGYDLENNQEALNQAFPFRAVDIPVLRLADFQKSNDCR